MKTRPPRKIESLITMLAACLLLVRETRADGGASEEVRMEKGAARHRLWRGSKFQRDFRRLRTGRGSAGRAIGGENFEFGAVDFAWNPPGNRQKDRKLGRGLRLNRCLVRDVANRASGG